MIKLVFFITLLVTLCVCDSDEENSYIDPVIDMLLNGVSEKDKVTEDIVDDEDSGSIGSIWKCGNCTDLGEAELVYTETNLADLEMEEKEVDVEINLEISHIRCVAVTSNQPGAVRMLVGACEGPSVTLNVSPSHDYTILVYT